jgi:hypothetical protein
MFMQSSYEPDSKFLQVLAQLSETFSFLPQADIIDFLQHLQLPGARTTLGVLTLAIDLDFFEEGLRLVKDADQVGWIFACIVGTSL